MPASEGQVTQLLDRWRSGDDEALDRLIPLVHEELKRVARHHMRSERAGHTLQPTALINEAYLRLIGLTNVAWDGRSHFFAVSAGIMRRILIDHARKRQAAKRGGNQAQVPIDESLSLFAPERSEELLALDDALTRLAKLDPRQTQVVELRYFAGLTVDETAAVLGISPKTVKRDWAVARAWLRAEIRR